MYESFKVKLELSLIKQNFRVDPIQSFCRFYGLNILTDDQKPTDAESIRNRWRFVCTLQPKVVENQYKMVYYSTYCVLVNRRKGARHLLDI